MKLFFKNSSLIYFAKRHEFFTQNESNYSTKKTFSMKKTTTFLLATFFLLLSQVVSAQAPNKFSFQALVKNASQEPIISSNVGLQISILPTLGGASVYSERHIATTNSNGLATIIIGNGTNQTGSFTGINWNSGTFFIKADIDPAGGTNYTITNTSQLLSVPYALQANEKDPKVSSASNNMVAKWNSSNTTLVDGIIYDNGSNVGIGTTTPTHKLEVIGKIQATNIQLTNGAAAGWFLKTDAVGNASWAPEADPKVQVTLQNTVPRLGGSNYLENGIITDNGSNIGIATTTPTAKLDVNGNTKTTLFQLTNGATAGHILQSDATGNASWINPSTITTNETDPQVAATSTNYVSKWNGTALVDGQIFDNGTNIGIGTTLPQEKLHIKNGNIFLDRGTSINNLTRKITLNGAQNANATFAKIDFNNFGNSVDYTGASIASNNANGNESGDIRFFTKGTGTLTQQMIIATNGSVGIGTTTPTQAKLVVNGSDNNTIGTSAGYGYLSRTTVNNVSNSTTADYSIYASDRIAASEFNAFSDERIKNIKGISNTSKDLETLNKIEITDYTLKDTIAKGNNNYKKVIAQQVEKVYPQAVSKMTDVIPNIYKQTEIKEGFVPIVADIKVGDKVKIIFESGVELVTVTELTSKGFKTNSTKSEKVFVFGKQVNDFHTVDYEALATLNISATQELWKEIQKLKAENTSLKAEVSSISEMKKDIEDLKSIINNTSASSNKNEVISNHK